MSDREELEYARGTHAHPKWLYRFSHLGRFQRAVELLNCRAGDRMLDYGSGDGYLLELLSARVPSADLTALEPLPYLQEEIKSRFSTAPLSILVSTTDLADRSFDRIACLEVLEHLQPDDVAHALQELGRLLADDGVLVISVPIEVGPSALLKWIASLLLTGSDRRFTFSEIVKATFGLPLMRDTENRFIPHKGFDFRRLRAQISERFIIEREVFSPVPFLRSALNAQVIWRLAGGGAARSESEGPALRG